MSTITNPKGRAAHLKTTLPTAPNAYSKRYIDEVLRQLQNESDGDSPLFPATATTLGGVKIGNNIDVSADGTISVSASASGPQGPAGPAGPQGPAGPPGLQGATGPQGATGATGATGSQGAPGVQGPVGPQGATGAQGSTGLQGPPGATGPQGDPGAMGPRGIQGDVGPAGPQGNPGSTGPQGPQGDPGATGPVGPQGPQGEQGPIGPAVNFKGSVPSEADLPLGPPTPKTGDAYITEDTGDLWVWNGTMWTNAGQIVGPPGPTGPQGPAGAVGPQGPQGVPGADGATGAAGPKGDPGPIGPRGDPGPTGPAGPDGATGAAGPTGPQGPQGNAGAQGPQGNPGATGATGATGPQGVQGPQGPAGPNIPATTTSLGGVIVGSGLNVDGTGKISVVAGGSQVNSDWLATSGPAQILNKPPIAWNGSVIGMGAQVDMGGYKVVNLANGTVLTDAVNLGQLNSAIAGVPVYTLPVATSSVLGGVKIGTNIAVAGDGTISLPTTISGAIAFSGAVTVTGLISANGGMALSNGQVISFGNAGTPGNLFKMYEDSAGNLYIDASANTGSSYVHAFRVGGAGNVFLDTGNLSVAGILSVTGASTLTGVITASNGMNVSNSKTIGFYDAGNTYIAHQISVGSGNAWNLSSSTTGNAGSYVATIQASNTGALTLLGPTTSNFLTPAGGYFKVIATAAYGDTNDGRITTALGAPGLNVVGMNTDNTGRKIAFWGSLSQQGTGPINNTFNNTTDFWASIRCLSGGSVTVWNSGNTAAGTVNADSSGNLYLSVNSGLAIVMNSAQTWGGAVNANTQNLLNVNQLTASGQATFSAAVNANGSLVVNATGTGTGYCQIINNGNIAGTGRNNPALYASGGNLDCIANYYVNGTFISNGAATFNNTVSISGSGLSVLGWGIKYPSLTTSGHTHGFGWNGSLQAYVDNSNVGNITLTSERWMKEDIQPYGRGLEAIRQLNPVSFRYIPQPWRGLGQTHYGLVADEVEPIMPEMVERNITDVKGMQQELRYLNPRPLWYVLLNAVKELDRQLTELRSKYGINH